MILFQYSRHGVHVDLRAGLAHGEGSDSIREVEDVIGSSNDDVILGNARGNLLAGGVIDGDEAPLGRDIFGGRQGIDFLFSGFCLGPTSECPGGRVAGVGNDLLRGGQQRDLLGVSGYGNTAIGGRGSDDFWFRGQSTVLKGGLGTDSFALLRGRAAVRGGSGIDHLSFSATRWELAPGPAHVDLALGTAGTPTVQARVHGVENALGTAGDDVLLGDDMTNHLLGFDGNDQLRGRAGDDSLDGGDGQDELIGGKGSDLCVNGETTKSCEH